LTLEALRARALALHRAGQLGEAQRIYTELGAALMTLGRYGEALASYEAALALEPQQPDALVSSAAALRALGRSEEALARASAALVRQPTPEAHCQQGGALRDLGRLGEAVASFDRAIALDPKCVDAHNGRGITLRQLERTTEALASFERALALRPAAAELHNNRGNVLRHLKRLPEALASLERAVELQPRFAAAYNNRGLVLQALQRYEEARASYAQALALKADYADAFLNLGALQYELVQPAAALASWQRALALAPGLKGIHGNLSSALRDLERPEEALAESELALSEDPASPVNHCNRGNALFDLGRFAEAIASYERAIERDAQCALAHFNMGLCLLLRGELGEGLRRYEWRKRLGSYPRAASFAPAWSGGEEIAGKRLYVYADHGLGDTIQFCRYASLAAHRGAQVVLAVQPQLTELLRELDPRVRIVALGEQPDRCDFQCALTSLPLAFGTTLARIPASVPYLAAEPLRVARWGRLLGETGLKVGIVWQGSRKRIDVGRSVPLEMFARLARIPGVRLISLQKGTARDQLRSASPALEVEGLGEDFDAGPQAFLDSAAVMTQLDLIVSCDTAPAHLAGALGRPTWIAVKHVPDWRWLLERTDCPWYPSVRLFRQSRRGDWEGVFTALETELASLARARPPTSSARRP
jgi:tetratricopeptide (TPR) repeat protein